MKHLPYWLTFATVMFFVIMAAANIPLMFVPLFIVAHMMCAGVIALAVQERFTGVRDNG
jgi:hypothetical protein